MALSTAGTGVVSDGTVSQALGESNEALIVNPSRSASRRSETYCHGGFTYGVFGFTEVDQMYIKAGLIGDMTLTEFVGALGKIPLQYEPGTQWHYSVSVDIQGRLLEVLAGMSFGEFLRQRLFPPLDMRDTSFYVGAEKQGRLAQLYKPKGVSATNFLARAVEPGLEVADSWIATRYSQPPKFESGGGGLLSTARDYLRFLQMMLNGGELDGVRVLSPKTVSLMTINHLGDLPMGFGRKGKGFGLGFGLILDSGNFGGVGSAEYYWGGVAGTRFWVDPQEKLIGIFMVQSVPHCTRLADDFRVQTYSAMTASQAGE